MTYEDTSQNHLAVIRCTSDDMEKTKYFATFFRDKSQMEDYLQTSNPYKALTSNPQVMRLFSGLTALAIVDITFAVMRANNNDTILSIKELDTIAYGSIEQEME